MDFVPLDDIRDDPEAIVARLRAVAGVEEDDGRPFGLPWRPIGRTDQGMTAEAEPLTVPEDEDEDPGDDPSTLSEDDDEDLDDDDDETAVSWAVKASRKLLGDQGVWQDQGP